MELKYLFGLQFTFSLVAWGAIGLWVVAPHLKRVSLRDALMLLLLPHLFRHGGIFLLVPGLVMAGMPKSFALSTAISDTLTQVLAVVSLAALHKRWRHAISIAWVFNVAACVDLVYNLIQAGRVGAERYLQAVWAAPTFLVPLMLVSHLMIFMTLLGYIKTAESHTKR